ncbi:MAG: collagen-like protein [Bacteroidales bacterium]|nr:collagen-like protein [Bacteroidales bacterium]
MQKQRIHNPQSFAWALIPGGIPLVLEGRTLRLFMRSDLDVVEIKTFTVAGNVISWTWAAAAQKYTGKYDAVLVEETGTDPDTVNTVIDVQATVELVAHSWEAVELAPAVINLTTTVSLIPGPVGPQGGTGATGNGIASASIDENGYLTLVYTDGTTWTSETSLRGPAGQDGADGQIGPQGPQGINGGLLYPTFEVDAAMHLQMDDQDAAVEGRITLGDNGHMYVNL